MGVGVVDLGHLSRDSHQYILHGRFISTVRAEEEEKPTLEGTHLTSLDNGDELFIKSGRIASWGRKGGF